MKKVKCFWCNEKVVDLIEHTQKNHPKLTPRSYDNPTPKIEFIKMDLRKLQKKYPNYIMFAFRKDQTMEEVFNFLK